MSFCEANILVVAWRHYNGLIGYVDAHFRRFYGFKGDHVSVDNWLLFFSIFVPRLYLKLHVLISMITKEYPITGLIHISTSFIRLQKISAIIMHYLNFVSVIDIFAESPYRVHFVIFFFFFHFLDQYCFHRVIFGRQFANFLIINLLLSTVLLFAKLGHQSLVSYHEFLVIFELIVLEIGD